MARSKRKRSRSQGQPQRSAARQPELEAIRRFPTPVGTYEYDRHRYRFDVLVTGVVGAAVMVVGLIMMLLGIMSMVALVMVVVGGYTAFNTYIAKCYPRTVSVDEGSISFTSFGRTDTFKVSEIEKFQVRENRSYLNTYVRINGGGATSGRYFINCGNMKDELGRSAQPLYVYLLVIEARLDPDGIRTGARHIADLIESLDLGQAETPDATQ